MKTKMKKYQGGGSTAADKAMATPAKSSTVKEKAAIPSASKMTTMQKGGSMQPKKPAVKNTVKKTSPQMKKKLDRAVWQQGQGWGTNQTMSLKTGGMVNPNAKLQAAKSAGSKGVKSGVNPKAVSSKVAKGRSGGTSKAPKTASPK
jgi:hypothetical protein